MKLTTVSQPGSDSLYCMFLCNNPLYSYSILKINPEIGLNLIKMSVELTKGMGRFTNVKHIMEDCLKKRLKVKKGNDQEIVQSEIHSHSKNRDGENRLNQQSGTYIKKTS